MASLKIKKATTTLNIPLYPGPTTPLTISHQPDKVVPIHKDGVTSYLYFANPTNIIDFDDNKKFPLFLYTGGIKYQAVSAVVYHDVEITSTGSFTLPPFTVGGSLPPVIKIYKLEGAQGGGQGGGGGGGHGSGETVTDSGSGGGSIYYNGGTGGSGRGGTYGPLGQLIGSDTAPVEITTVDYGSGPVNFVSGDTIQITLGTGGIGGLGGSGGANRAAEKSQTGGVGGAAAYPSSAENDGGDSLIQVNSYTVSTAQGGRWTSGGYDRSRSTFPPANVSGNPGGTNPPASPGGAGGAAGSTNSPNLGQTYSGYSGKGGNGGYGGIDTPETLAGSGQSGYTGSDGKCRVVIVYYT